MGKVKNECSEEEFMREVEEQNSTVYSMLERVLFDHDELLSEKNRELDTRILFTHHQEPDITAEEVAKMADRILKEANYGK